jgi:hypothetical protein
VRLERVIRSWPDDGSTRAILARSNRELLPAVAVALHLGLSFRAPRIELLLDDPALNDTMALLRTMAAEDESPLLTIARLRRRRRDALCEALLGWAPSFANLDGFLSEVDAARTRLWQLRRDDAPMTLATAHATKGLEFDHVVVTGMEAGRFPSARSVSDAAEPARAYEEERRLAYVAWTRARKTLTLLYDPAVPSPFLLESFSAEELGINAEHRPGGFIPGRGATPG